MPGPEGGEPGGEDDLDAGGFSAWLAGMEEALAGRRAADVPCGTCTACCTSSQFVLVGPDEVDTLAHIPRRLLFPAPRLPRGHVVLGYDERGHCPMLVEGRCSIYEHRPRTCRTYDCRVFPAAGVEADDDKPLIAARARRWRFRHPAPDDRALHDAVRAAAAFVEGHAGDLPEEAAPRNRTQQAVLAVEVHRPFVGGAAPGPEAVRVEISRRRRGDPRPG
ncbi:MAG TPA: YkgJ family cysteine cluster protein [Acidimicrobiales bacterium]|nr:YkgJ family cysteine cluster protein [Acidimicrobiales bacterium]